MTTDAGRITLLLPASHARPFPESRLCNTQDCALRACRPAAELSGETAPEFDHVHMPDLPSFMPPAMNATGLRRRDRGCAPAGCRSGPGTAPTGSVRHGRSTLSERHSTVRPRALLSSLVASSLDSEEALKERPATAEGARDSTRQCRGWQTESSLRALSRAATP